jgi:methylglyoxal synthase
MKKIALIAHDEKKEDLIKFARQHQAVLQNYKLMATGTTGRRLNTETELEVERKESGPLGGDQQIGAEIAGDNLEAVIFLRDPLTAQPHEPDVTALLRVSDVHDVALATNLSTAHLVLNGLKLD